MANISSRGIMMSPTVFSPNSMTPVMISISSRAPTPSSSPSRSSSWIVSRPGSHPAEHDPGRDTIQELLRGGALEGGGAREGRETITGGLALGEKSGGDNVIPRDE